MNSISHKNFSSTQQAQDKLKHLHQIQMEMFNRIKRNQENTLKQCQKKSHLMKCSQERSNQIKTKTFKQIVTHPYNGDQGIGNGCWVYLANFVNNNENLSDIQLRMKERQQIRKKMQQNALIQKRKAEQLLQLQYNKYNKSNQQLKNNKNTKKNFKNDKEDKMAFKLQQELHRRDVQQNKKRLQRIRQVQREKIQRKIHHF